MSGMIASDPPTPGMRLVLRLGEAAERTRVTAGGTIVETSPWSRGDGGPSGLGFRCVLDDGTGRVDLLFLGRDRVPGLVSGARCHVEGTARMDHGRLTIWNPLYRLGPDGPAPGGGTGDE